MFNSTLIFVLSFISIISIVLLFFSLIQDYLLSTKLRKSEEEVKNLTKQSYQKENFLDSLQKLLREMSMETDFDKIVQEIVNSLHDRFGYIGGGVLITHKMKKRGTVIDFSKFTNDRFIKKAINIIEKRLKDKDDKEKLLYKYDKQGKLSVLNNVYSFYDLDFTKKDLINFYKIKKLKTVVLLPIADKKELKGILIILVDTQKNKIKDFSSDIMNLLSDQICIFLKNISYYRQVSENTKLSKINTKLRELDNEKSEFISMTSHQLRTPLTVVKGYLSMLSEGFFGKISPSVTGVLGKITDSTERLIGLVNDLLNVSIIESGHLHLVNKTIKLDVVTKKIVEELKVEATKKKLKIKFENDKTVNTLVKVDIDKIREVIYNLIDNSIKYSGKGKYIKIKMYNKKGKVYLSIQDEGIGLSSKDKEHLFKKFARGGTKDYSSHTSGIGFGLFVCKKILEALGGSISAYSAGRGKGSTFTISLDNVDID